MYYQRKIQFGGRGGAQGCGWGGGGGGGAHTYVLTASGIWSLKRGKVRCVYTITIITVSVSVQLGVGGGVISVYFTVDEV